MSRFPFGIPNSWYVLAYADELAAGDVKALHALGRELVLFRTESGEAHVVDAYCPHLGAHLGVGGRVVGDTIRCPFHGWRFDGEGRCVDVPYAKRRPASARLDTYPVRETSGMIFAWLHAEGAEPEFEIPEVEGWGEAGWLDRWLRWEWTVKTHPQEMAENGIDWPHFATIHGMEMPEDRSCDFREHSFVWQVGGDKPVSALESGVDSLQMFGENWGLGFNWIRQSGAFDTVVATGLTPIDEETTHVRMGVIANVGEDAGVEAREQVRAYMAEHAVFAEQDFPIWENKLHRERPMLCAEDGPIVEFRRWAARFYSAAS